MADKVGGAATLDDLEQSGRAALRRYVDLMQAFLTERISPTEFESNYIDLFLSDQRIWPGWVYERLNDVFLDVDAYCADPAIRGRFDIDESQLRTQVATAVAALRE